MKILYRVVFVLLILNIMTSCNNVTQNSTTASAGTEQLVVDFIDDFNLWSDVGLHQRPEYERLEKSGLDLGVEGTNLLQLLSPRCKIMWQRSGQRVEQNAKEFVNGIQRSRFMWKMYEGLLEDPRYDARGSSTVVRMLKYQVMADPQSPDAWVFSCVVTIERETSGYRIVNIARKYRRPDEQEMQRIQRSVGAGRAETEPQRLEQSR